MGGSVACNSQWAQKTGPLEGQDSDHIHHRMLPVPNTIHDVRMDKDNADELTHEETNGWLQRRTSHD